MSNDRLLACPVCGEARLVASYEEGDRPCMRCKGIAALVPIEPIGPWVADAACASVDPELWFPEYAYPNSIQGRAAKEICNSCLVQTECLIYAFNNNEEHGIWGGTTPEERRRIKRGGAA